MRAALAASLIVVSTAALAQAPALDVAPSRLSFIAAAGGTPPAQTVQIRHTAQAPVRWQARASAPWIRLSATSGTGDAPLQIGVDTNGLAPGQHLGQVTVSHLEGTAGAVVSVVVQVQGRSSANLRASTSLPTALTLSAPAGSREPVSALMSLQEGEGAPEAWRVEPDQPWLNVEPSSGDVPARISVTATPGTLPPGEYMATLVFTGANGEPWMKIPVAFVVGGNEALSITTDLLPPATRNLPYSQAIPIRGGRPPYTIRIIHGRLPQGLLLSGGGISGVTRFVGTYPLVLAVTDASTPPATATQEVLLQVIVLYQDTALVVSPPTLSLAVSASQRSQGARLAVGSGRQPLAWTATSDASWLRLSPDRGISPSAFQLDVHTAVLQPGTYTATITITMEGAPNSPARIPVQVVVRK